MNFGLKNNENRNILFTVQNTYYHLREIEWNNRKEQERWLVEK